MQYTYEYDLSESTSKLFSKVAILEYERAKNWHSEISISTFPTFQTKHTLFFGFVLGSYCRKRHEVTVM